MNYKDILGTIPIEDSCWDIDYLLRTEGEIEEQQVKNVQELFLPC